MGRSMKTARLRIGGMTCVNCQNKIEQKLRGAAGVASAQVSYAEGAATVTYDAGAVSLKGLAARVEGLGYTVLTGAERPGSGAVRAAGLMIVIAALYALLEQTGALNLLAPSRLAEAGMGYGMLFVIGLVTSVHCVAMCGGINLSQCIPRGAESSGGRFSALRPTLLYNLGRVLSYTAVGFVVGALGSAITFSSALQGALKLVAGVFMILMGVNMLSIFPWLRKLNPRLPKALALRIGVEKTRSRSPLIVGLLNGLMPCGPLQAMQIYALSTGNPVSGALSMLLFSLGTVPLMFGLGAVSSVLGGKSTRKVMTAGAVLVVVLGLSMFTQGWSLSGVTVPDLIPAEAVSAEAGVPAANDGKAEGGVQVVNSTLKSGQYPSITVQAGMPVKWIIDAPEGSVNGCNNRMFINEYGIEHQFRTGENVIEFTPAKAGKIPYSCWMGMIRGTITVVEAGADSPSAASDASPADGPVPAGYTIPANSVAVAKRTTDDYEGEVQTVGIDLTDEGFSPAIVVVEDGRNVNWTILDKRSAADAGTRLLVPEYATELPLEKGANPLYFTPDVSFDFSTGDNAFYGYVKVVDDLSGVDLDAVRAEAAARVTLVYPADYFAGGDSESAGGCCG